MKFVYDCEFNEELSELSKTVKNVTLSSLVFQQLSSKLRNDQKFLP